MTSSESLDVVLLGYKSRIAKEVRLRLNLERDLVFNARTNNGYEIDFDARLEWGGMPTEALLASVAGCMAIDIVSILKKMRTVVSEFHMEVIGHRNPFPPQRFTRIALHADVAGSGITAEKMELAARLSKEKYCSVYHSLRRDLELELSWELREVHQATEMDNS